MSREEFDDLNQEDAKPAKRKMTLEAFLQQFNTLDTHNYGSWPFSVKLTCWIFLFLLVCAIGYF